MATVAISSRYRKLAEKLTYGGASGIKIFPNFMELFLFAAMVGYDFGKKEELDSKARDIEIKDHTFAKNDGLVFLLALNEKEDGEILRDNNEADCWRIVEEYANGGFGVIEGWLVESPSDADGANTILRKIKEQAIKISKTEHDEITPDIEI